MRRFIVIGLLLCAATTAGCGWHLRGWYSQTSLTAMHVVAVDRYAPLTLALLDTLQQRAVTDDPEAALQLHLANENLSKHIVAVTRIGSPAQYEMALSVTFRYISEGQADVAVKQTATVFRVFDFDPKNTVAKTEEENTLLDEMRRELAHRILQRIPKKHGQAQL